MNSWSTKGGVSSDKETVLNAKESACAFAESSIKSGFATVKKHTNAELHMSKKFPMNLNCTANNPWGITIQPNGNFSPAFDTFSCMMIGSQYTTSCFGARTLPETCSQEINWSFDGVKRNESDNNKQELLQKFKPCGWQKFRESTSCSIDFLL